MNPAQLSAAVRAAVADCLKVGDFAGVLPDEVHVERPKNRDHGDYATNVALRLAKDAGLPPRQIAELIAIRLRTLDGISSVEIAGAGFLNITFSSDVLGQLARTIVDAGASYGNSDSLVGRNINLEFVSVNPTGPIHLGGTRWAAVGDSLARILQANGATVTREFYFNDHGAQIDRFARSLMARAHDQAAPEDGYTGAYIDEIAAAVLTKAPEAMTAAVDVAQELFRSIGVELMFGEIRESLHQFGVDFDVYFHENSVYESGAVDQAVSYLKDSGSLYFNDGAWWLRTTDFGDDKDRVVIKSDGKAAYIAGDLAYLRNKRARGFDLCIYMLGADHHGYIARLRAAASAFGDDPEVVEVLIGQMVNLVKDGKPVRMSKRAGTVITMEDLVDAVGVDAARYSLARSSIDTVLDIDLDLLSKKSNENPVYYVQYAHARLARLQRTATDLGLVRSAKPDLGLLKHVQEADLLGALGEFPRLVASAAELRSPHRIAHYLESLAGRYHRFYEACRVLPQGDEQPGELVDPRLWLCEATRVVLANGLAMLGVSAPDRM